MIEYYILSFLICLTIIFFALCFYCYRTVFFSKPRKPLSDGEYDIPSGESYQKLRDLICKWQQDSRTMPHENFEIKSFDGTILRAKYYEYKKGAPIEIMFNGYRGNAERDMSGGIDRCFSLKRNALLVNQRGCGNSDGNLITFGILERRDCLAWVDFAVKKFGSDCSLILTGISMGAATVIMASAENLCPNVKYVIADCPYTSAKEIILTVMKKLGVPPKTFYPFVKWGARIFGGFNLEETTPMEAVKKTSLPIFFIHGDADDFIPYQMSENLHLECVSQSALVLTAGADHGLCYPVDKEQYLTELLAFEKTINFNQK